MPKILFNQTKLKHNIDFFRNYCHSLNLELVGVLKSGQAIPLLVEAFQKGRIPVIALSRLRSVSLNADILRSQPLLIGLPSPSRVAGTVRLCAASFNSEICTIRALARAAQKIGCPHGIYLMVEIGDLREGVLPQKVIATVRKIIPLLGKNLIFLGLAANLGCASGTLPSAENMALLQEAAEEIEARLNLPVSKVSVGGTVVYPWLLKNPLPSKINQLRIGEGILCGHAPGYNIRLEGLHDDIFLFQGQVLEYREKVSPPPGPRGLDALGHTPSLGPAGRRKRAILDFGLLDTRSAGLTSCLPGIRIVTSNSEYTITDVTDCPEKIAVGDVLDFKPDYEALTQALVSPFVEVIPVDK